MKINQKILHLPPFISTSWSEVSTIFFRDEMLHISMLNGETVAIAGLPTEVNEMIFKAHLEYLTHESMNTSPPSIPYQILQIGSLPYLPGAPQQEETIMHTEVLRFNLDNMESMSSAMQHNPAHAHMPNIPKEIINKIAQVAKIVASDDIQNLPQAEPHCNCTHCQIARAIHNQEPISLTQPKEEIVTEKDLKFQQWDIVQTEGMFYSVINRLDAGEKYSVHLGHPIGCTCGITGCEHILAVLKS